MGGRLCLCFSLWMTLSCACQRSAIANHRPVLIVKKSNPTRLWRCLQGSSLCWMQDFYRHKSVSHPVVVVVLYMFWLSLITLSKRSETTRELIAAQWRGTLICNFLLFNPFDTFVCTIQLIRTFIPFITVMYTVIIIKRCSLHNKGILLRSHLHSQESFTMLLTWNRLPQEALAEDHQSILHHLRFLSSRD